MMVARSAQDQHPSYLHLVGEDEFSQPLLYYDLQPISQNCCTALMYPESGQPPSNEMAMELPQVDSTREECLPKKRKAESSYHEGSDDDTGDDKSVRTDDTKKQNHSVIEKRRRDKMNTYITELSAMVPMCHAMSRKLDKLTVLRMAVQHMKTIRGAVQSYTDGNYKPSFLSDVHLKQLIKQAAEGFLFVVGCDRGKILYVSESVTQALNYTQADLLCQSWFDILHPKDVAVVKDQLTSSHLSPRERFIDAKTMLPVKTDLPQHGSKLGPGSRRSFFCRMKCKAGSTTVKEEADTTTGCHRRKKSQNSDKKYRVIQCTGYLKPWTATKQEEDKESESDGDTCNLSCLVAMGRVITVPFSPCHNKVSQGNINVRPLQFISRHALDGKFLFVDQRVTLVLSYLPQELLGTSMYEYYHRDDIPHLAECHKVALQSKEPTTTKVYKFRSKDGTYVQIKSEWKSFKNPWTKEREFMVAKNSRIPNDHDSQVESSAIKAEVASQSQNFFDHNRNTHNNGEVGGRELSKYITSHVEASNIGRKIADEVIDEQRRFMESPSLTSSTPSPSHLQPLPEVFSTQSQSPEDLLVVPPRQVSKTPCSSDEYSRSSGQNVALGHSEGEEMIEMVGEVVSPQQTAPSECNDEAAMAVIMSLLEADAGLGGPVDFTGLPWPLP